MDELNDILKGADQQPSEEPPKEEPKAEEIKSEAEAKPEAEPEKEERVEPTGESEPPPEAEPEPSAPEGQKQVPLATFLDERDNRKTAQRRVQELEAQLAQQQQQPVEIPDVTTDPEGYAAHVQQQAAQQVSNATLSMSVAMVRAQYPDFDAKSDIFIKMAETRPALLTEMLAHPHPGLFAYNTAAQHEALQAIGDPATYKERLEAEIREKIKAEAAQEKAPPKPSLPQSIAQVPASDAKSGPGDHTTDMSLDSILSG